MLWRDLKILQIYGSNTDVGKSIMSVLLCKAFKKKSPNKGVLYLKPVSTGPLEDADTRYVCSDNPCWIPHNKAASSNPSIKYYVRIGKSSNTNLLLILEPASYIGQTHITLRSRSKVGESLPVSRRCQSTSGSTKSWPLTQWPFPNRKSRGFCAGTASH